MTIATFIERVEATRRRDGRRPVRVDLPAEDVAELVAEVKAKPAPTRCCCACHLHEPAQTPTSGYVMTLVGVEVWVKGDTDGLHQG